MVRRKARILVGTSGWSYGHWRGAFYPPALPETDWLGYYAERFASVEINNTFYRLPEQRTLRGWRDSVPADFVFTVKASRYITHIKKLKEPEKGLATFLERISVLEDKLGPILFQLPPRWRVNPERLAGFLGGLSRDFRYAFEFRDRSWLDQEVYRQLEQHGVGFCIYELDGYLSPKKVTADFVYVRLHGPAGPYQGSYDSPTLSGWAGAFSAWSAQGRSIFCYFDNDQAGYATTNAAQLQSMLHIERGRR
jgi:uncharacterized protein YecE (DUF72 family)